MIAERDRVEHLLREHGIKPTKQRMEVGMVLLSKPCHMSADQILNTLRDNGNKISKATVYNTLNLFSNLGVVREVAVDPTHMMYDSTVHPHHHFYNTDTGELIDINSPQIQISGLPELPQGMTRESVELIVRIRSDR
jgi:Fur family iron response transcriptional regulator